MGWLASLFLLSFLPDVLVDGAVALFFTFLTSFYAVDWFTAAAAEALGESGFAEGGCG
jgi:hypothetical protein